MNDGKDAVEAIRELWKQSGGMEKGGVVQVDIAVR